jgi:hypothetical protein
LVTYISPESNSSMEAKLSRSCWILSNFFAKTSDFESMLKTVACNGWPVFFFGFHWSLRCSTAVKNTREREKEYLGIPTQHLPLARKNL